MPMEEPSHSPVEVNAKEFADWVFQIPTKRRMKPLKASDIVAVGRRLAGLATTQPDLGLLHPVAMEVFQLMTRVPEGRIATNEECQDFLRQFLPYMPALSLQDMDAVHEALRRTKDAEVRRAPRNPKQLEYLIERPTRHVPNAAYLPKRSRRPAEDDISERVALAYDGMQAARCGRAYECVGEALRRSGLVEESYCTASHIKSRIRALGPRTPLLKLDWPYWLDSYWDTRHPELVNEPVYPRGFVFAKCDC